MPLVSLSTFCLSYAPLRTTFRLAAEAGFDGVELVLGPEVWLGGAQHVAALSRHYGLPILSIHQTLLRFSPTGGGPGRMLEAARMGMALGCPRVVIHAPTAASWNHPGAQDWLNTLERCLQETQGSGIRLTLENHGVEPNPGASGGEGGVLLLRLPRLVQFAQSHDLDLTLDTCHAGLAGVPLLQAWEAVRSRCSNVHFSDLKDPKGLRRRLPFRSSPLELVFAHHQVPGEGMLPLAELIGRMRSDGYKGPLTYEVGPVALRIWSPRRLRQQLRRLVTFARQAEAAPSPGAA